MSPQIDANRYTNEMLFELLEVLPVPMYAYAPDGDRYDPIYMNQRCLDMLGAASLDDAIAFYEGSMRNFFLSSDLGLVRDSTLRALESEGDRVAYECHIATMDHRICLARVLSEARTTADGHRIVVNLVVALGARPETVDYKSSDPVTGLINMHSFFHVMRRWRKHFSPEGDGSELAVMYLDVVNFQSINIHDGIEGGDAFLKAVGDHLRMLFPASAVSRFDVDHFALLMHADNLDAKASLARDMLLALAPKGVSSSIGACVWQDHELSAETICSRAKIACDVGKRRPGGPLSLYTDEMGRDLEVSEYVVSNVEGAVRNGWIHVYYQPIIGSVSGEVCGMEALARWDDPTRGLLQPSSFVEPLEDSRLIWVLDLCVIRQVVTMIADRSRQGLPEIPVSVNISRVDFSCCDVFSEVESLVEEHDIPRRTLHIEVTESAFASEEGEIVETLARFRKAGYEVWMDDFGSGYSSLNLLKEYDFDVLKLDMAFLRNDTPRSRAIISSVISMGKKIGVRTLAEGVETPEQADFLSMAGCSMMQGYHFGRPLPFEETLERSQERGFVVEDVQHKAYYEAAAGVDFLTDAPLVLYDFHRSHFRILQTNAAARQMFSHYGLEDAQQFEDAVNDWNKSSNNALDYAMSYADRTGKAGEQAITFSGKEMLFRFRSLAHMEGHSLIVAKYFDVTERLSEITSMAKATTRILEFYRNVFFLDLRRQAIRSLRYGNNLTGGLDKDFVPLRGADGSYNDLLPKVLDVDEARYRTFLDPDTLEGRLADERDGVLRSIFRTMGRDGGFRWMEHMLVLLQGSDGTQALYGIRPLDIQDLERELTSANDSAVAAQFSRDEGTGGILWDSLMAHTPLKVFWKDKDRRFCGASRSFLDYYGLDSAHDLLGKTDDDLRWHPIEQGYRDAELEVLRHGRMSRDVPGKCITKGVSRAILATRWPIYRDGRIAGLMGYFREDPAARRRPDPRGTDAGGICETGRFMDDLLSYEVDYELNRSPFGMLRIKLPEFPRIAKECGAEAASLLDSACSSAILGLVGNRGSVARLSTGCFAILGKYRSRAEILELGERVRKTVESIHRVGAYDLTIFADVRVIYAEVLDDFMKKLSRSLMAGDLSGGTDAGEMSLEAERDFRALLDSVPLGCSVLGPDHTVLYWSHEAERLLGVPSDELLGSRCADLPLGCVDADGDEVPESRTPTAIALATGRPSNAQLRAHTKTGGDVLLREVVLPMKDNTGRIRELLSLFAPVGERGDAPEHKATGRDTRGEKDRR